MSNYIGTRNIGQVRSHLQKYLIKQKKLKEKAKKINIDKIDESKDVDECKEKKDDNENKLNEEEEQNK